ncbi:Potassium-transporting ATPase ATP-binding subunit [uncultured archaeon]|nr:Potassium-transporting ATPase ATP-binding subunit [uncultured archaeon]
MDSAKLIDAGAIFMAVLIAASFGFWQEYKAEAALDALKKMVVQRVVVVREAKETEIDSRSLVIGDVVILEEGSKVPADMRLLQAINLSCDQSALTGESLPSEKEACAVPAKSPVSEQRNMLFAGTVVVRGHCRGLVVAAGMATEFGKIAGYVAQDDGEETPLQRNISDLSKTLGYAGITLAVAFFIIGIIRGEPAAGMFVVAVTLAVAVIPEGLPTVLAITLALGVQKMAKRNAIVRRMNAVETLGSATVICTDKTGTITQNRMAVQEIVLPEETYSIAQGSLDENAMQRDIALARAVEIMALCNNALKVVSEGEEKMSGDPTEIALLSAAEDCGADERQMRDSHALVGEVPFDSDRKAMSSIRMYGKERLALVKGAPEKLLPKCARVLTQKGERRMTPGWRKKLSADSHSLGVQGMRVLALACRKIGKQDKYSADSTERDLTYVGLAAMEDPPRPEVAEAIRLCRSAGIKVVMVTGDSLPTARAIASRVGLLEAPSRVLDGAELAGMPDDKLGKMLPGIDVFARVTPEEKFRIVSAFKRRGEVVAVTGDGVNDSPAISKADIGVAMGITGTDVTKQVSDIILTDDNFASIVSAVKAGRTIFNNIKSFVRYQISTNVAALSLMFAAPVFGLPLPLIPVQILWINIMIDGPPALALGAEPASQDEMKKPPRNARAGFIGRDMAVSVVVLGLVMASIALAVFGFYLTYAPERAYTVVFTLFVFLQLFNALNCRSASESIIQRIFSNPYLYAAILVSLAIHMAIVYFQPLQEVFKTVALGGQDLAIIAGAAFLIIVAEELKKKFLPHTTAY